MVLRSGAMFRCASFQLWTQLFDMINKSREESQGPRSRATGGSGFPLSKHWYLGQTLVSEREQENRRGRVGFFKLGDGGDGPPCGRMKLGVSRRIRPIKSRRYVSIILPSIICRAYGRRARGLPHPFLNLTQLNQALTIGQSTCWRRGNKSARNCSNVYICIRMLSCIGELHSLTSVGSCPSSFSGIPELLYIFFAHKQSKALDVAIVSWARDVSLLSLVSTDMDEESMFFNIALAATINIILMPSRLIIATLLSNIGRRRRSFNQGFSLLVFSAIAWRAFQIWL